jgi:hypothetical protein
MDDLTPDGEQTREWNRPSSAGTIYEHCTPLTFTPFILYSASPWYFCWFSYGDNRLKTQARK